MASYYTATTGNDGNPGTFASPFLTIVHGTSVLTAGDTLWVRAGDYDEGLSSIPSGTSWGNKVRIVAFPLETVWLRPLVHLVGNPGDCVRLNTGNEHYIEFDGINMDSRNVGYGCVEAISDPYGDPHHLRFQNAEFIARSTDNSAYSAWGQWAVGLGGHSAPSIIGGNELINLTIHGGGRPGSDVTGNGYAVYLMGPSNLVENCDFYDNSAATIQIYNSSGPSPDNNIIRNCRLHDISRSGNPSQVWGMIISGNNNQIYNNLIYNINAGGVGDGLFVYSGSGNLLYNNSIYNVAAVGVNIYNGSGTEVKCNIVYAAGGSDFVDTGSGTVQSYNLFGTDPVFVNASTGDFRLQSTSPAINTGISLSIVTTDFDGGTRPFGPAPDIGAYEWGAATATNWRLIYAQDWAGGTADQMGPGEYKSTLVGGADTPSATYQEYVAGEGNRVTAALGPAAEAVLDIDDGDGNISAGGGGTVLTEVTKTGSSGFVGTAADQIPPSGLAGGVADDYVWWPASEAKVVIQYRFDTARITSYALFPILMRLVQSLYPTSGDLNMELDYDTLSGGIPTGYLAVLNYGTTPISGGYPTQHTEDSYVISVAGSIGDVPFTGAWHEIQLQWKCGTVTASAPGTWTSVASDGYLTLTWNGVSIYDLQGIPLVINVDNDFSSTPYAPVRNAMRGVWFGYFGYDFISTNFKIYVPDTSGGGGGGSGASLTYRPQKNGTDAGPSVTISGTTTGSDTTHSFQIADGDTCSMAQIPAGAPTMSFVSWGMTQVVSSAGPPTVTTDGATNITETSACIAGTFVPNGVTLTGHFIFGSDNPPTQISTTPQSISSGGESIIDCSDFTGLTPGTTYYYQAIGFDGVTYFYGAIRSFTTPDLPDYDNPCSIRNPTWWGVIKGQATTYKGGDTTVRDADTRFGGLKPPRLLSFSSIKRSASDWRTNAWQANGCTVRWADTDYQVRAEMDAAESGSMLSDQYWHFLDCQEWRETGKNPWLVFQGQFLRDRLVGDMTWEGDVRDSLGAGFSISRPEVSVPTRKAWLDFGSFGYSDAGKFGIEELCVPIIAGTHSDETAMTPLGRVPIFYGGTLLCADAVTRHVGILSGHANDGGVINAYAMSGSPAANRITWGTNAWAPGQAGWATVNPSGAALYTDLVSPSDGLTRRYTILLFDDTGDTLGTDFSKGDQEIDVNTHGFTLNPDGTGGEITQAHAQVLHCLQNFFGWGVTSLANPDNVWNSGAWLDTPKFDFYPSFFPGTEPQIPRFDDISFATAADVSATYTAGNVPFKGAFILGLKGKSEAITSVAAKWATNFLFQWGWNVKYSQLFITMLDRRRSQFLANATIVTDRTNTLLGKPIRVELQDELVISQMLTGWDFNYRTNQYEQLNVGTGDVGTRDRFGQRPGPNEGYQCISDTVTADAVTTQRFAFMNGVRYMVKWSESVCGLGRELLSAVKMTHFAGRGSGGYGLRALYVQSHTINQDGSVNIEAFDVDDLLS